MTNKITGYPTVSKTGKTGSRINKASVQKAVKKRKRTKLMVQMIVTIIAIIIAISIFPKLIEWAVAERWYATDTRFGGEYVALIGIPIVAFLVTGIFQDERKKK